MQHLPSRPSCLEVRRITLWIFAESPAEICRADVNDFLAARPDYNPQLRAKILQAADPLFRANALTATGGGTVPRR